MLARRGVEVLGEHVTVEVECINRIYLNGYVPFLHTDN